MVEWSLNIGESVQQIVEGRFVSLASGDHSGDNRNNEQLLVLTERSLFLIKVFLSLLVLSVHPHLAYVCLCVYDVF